MKNVVYVISGNEGNEVISLEKIGAINSVDQLICLGDKLNKEWVSIKNSINILATQRHTIEKLVQAIDDRRRQLLEHDKERAREDILQTVIELEQKILKSTDVELPAYTSTFDAINSLKKQYKSEQ